MDSVGRLLLLDLRELGFDPVMKIDGEEEIRQKVHGKTYQGQREEGRKKKEESSSQIQPVLHKQWKRMMSR